MARTFGARQSEIGKQAHRRYDTQADFQGPVITGGVASGSEAAADMVDVSGAYAANRRNATRFDDQANTSIAARARRQASAFKSEGIAAGAAMTGIAQVTAAREAAETAKKMALEKSRSGIASAGLGAALKIGAGLLTGGIGGIA